MTAAELLKRLCLIVFSWFHSRMGAAEALQELPPPAVPDLMSGDGGSPRRCQEKQEQDKQDKQLQQEDHKDGGDDDGEALTIEQARIVIKQLRDRCRFQTHQTLLWRKKAKMQVRRSTSGCSDYDV